MVFMQHVGLLAVFIYWITVGSILYKFGIDTTKTVSDHVATGPQRKIYTPLALTYFALMNVHLFAWLLPHYDAQFYQYALLAFGMFFLLFTFLIPRHGANINKHDVYASLVGLSLLGLVSTLIFERVSGLLELLYTTLLCVLLLVGSSLMKRDRRGYLQTQVFFFAMLNILILSLTYL